MFRWALTTVLAAVIFAAGCSPGDNSSGTRTGPESGQPDGGSLEVVSAFVPVFLSGTETAGCALDVAGHMECWGYNFWDVFWDVVEPEDGFVSVSVGGSLNCALDTQGAIKCWGYNEKGQLDAPQGVFNSVDAGINHACAIDAEGSVVCWGDNTYGQSAAPGGTFTAVSAGETHSCAVGESGTVLCWGGGVVAAEGKFVEVSAGQLHTCALDVNQAVLCWGRNDYGQTDAPAGSYSAVDVGSFHSCALDVTGGVDCWGRNDYGQTDAPQGEFKAVSSLGAETCGLRADGSIICWGIRDVPGGTYTDVAAGSCALRVDGSPECWWNESWPPPTPHPDVPEGPFKELWLHTGGTCGRRTTGGVVCWKRPIYDNQPTEVPGGDYTAFATRGSFACGIGLDSSLSCWFTLDGSSVQVPEGRFIDLDFGGQKCGVRTDQAVVCWDYTDPGLHLLNSSGEDYALELLEAPDGAFVSVAVGTNHACAIGTDGSVSCWGDGTAGQLRAPGGDFVEIAAVDDHTCGLRPNGQAECWGGIPTCDLDPDGRLSCGGVDIGHRTFALAGPLTNLDAGNSDFCALRPDGTIVCWSSGATPRPHFMHWV